MKNFLLFLVVVSLASCNSKFMGITPSDSVPEEIYYTLGDCCIIEIHPDDEPGYKQVKYINSRSMKDYITVTPVSLVDSIVKERAYYCEWRHTPVPFNYKIKR